MPPFMAAVRMIAKSTRTASLTASRRIVRSRHAPIVHAVGLGAAIAYVHSNRKATSAP